MALMLGMYRSRALGSVFRMAGSGGYSGSSGLTRKRLDAMFSRFYHMA